MTVSADVPAESIWGAYLEVMADPGHLLAELTFMFLLDVLLLGLAVPLLRRILHRRLDGLHQQLDVEHDIDHDQAVRKTEDLRTGPSDEDLRRMREEGMEPWLLAMIVDHYRPRSEAVKVAKL